MEAGLLGNKNLLRNRRVWKNQDPEIQYRGTKFSQGMKSTALMTSPSLHSALSR